MNKKYIQEIEFEIIKRLMAVLLLLGCGVGCLDEYFDIFHIIIGWTFVVISVAYMAYMGYCYIALRIKSRES